MERNKRQRELYEAANTVQRVRNNGVKNLTAKEAPFFDKALLKLTELAYDYGEGLVIDRGVGDGKNI